MNRITAASETSAENILPVENESSGNFKVKSQLGDAWFDVRFGDCTNMPKCTCYDFSHTGLPCKHFFAILTTSHSGSGHHYQPHTENIQTSHLTTAWLQSYLTTPSIMTLHHLPPGSQIIQIMMQKTLHYHRN